jgi:hypothetical protein
MFGSSTAVKVLVDGRPLSVLIFRSLLLRHELETSLDVYKTSSFAAASIAAFSAITCLTVASTGFGVQS